MFSRTVPSLTQAAGMLLALALLAGGEPIATAAAQSQPPQAAAGGPPGGRSAFGPWFFGLSGGALHQYRTNLKDKPGDFSVNRGFIQGSAGYAWDRRTRVALSIGGGQSSYDFADTVSIAGGKPWGRIRDARLSLPVFFGVADRGTAIVIPTVRSYAEQGASLDDGRTEGLLLGLGWRFSDRLEIGPGVGWFSEIGDSSNIFPILVIDWDINDRLKLSTGRGLAASQGPGLTLDWRVSKKVSLGITGRYERVRFRLDDKGAVPNGIGEDRSLPLILTFGFSPTPKINISAFAGAEFAGELRVRTPSGENIEKVEYDPAPVVGLAFRARF